MAAVSFLGARVQQQPRTVRVQTARAAVCQSAPAPAVGRRALAASLLALPTLLAVRPALALLPDDEDEECVPVPSAQNCPGSPLASPGPPLTPRLPGCWPRPRLGARTKS